MDEDLHPGAELLLQIGLRPLEFAAQVHRAGKHAAFDGGRLFQLDVIGLGAVHARRIDAVGQFGAGEVGGEDQPAHGIALVHQAVAAFRRFYRPPQRHIFFFLVGEDVFAGFFGFPRQVGRRCRFLPAKEFDEVGGAENFVGDDFQVGQLFFADGNEDDAVIRQQGARHFQAAVHHRQPVGVQTAIILVVTARLVAGFACLLPGAAAVHMVAFGEFVLVDEVVAGVVRRIDIDHFHFAGVIRLQEFQRFQIVAFDKEIVRVREIHAFRRTEAQTVRGRRVGGKDGGALARPVQAVTFLRAFGQRPRQFLTQQVEIHDGRGFAMCVPAFADAVGEESGDFRQRAVVVPRH